MLVFGCPAGRLQGSEYYYIWCTAARPYHHSHVQSISATSAREQQCLHEEVAKLQLQLASLSSELDAEKQKCRLLMDYPDQSCDGPIQPLSGRESQQQISANTIRILLLEEQNSELRETIVQHARKSNCKRKPKVSS